jgi:hypothetical protein
LALTGFIPIVSCRGHARAHAWSPYPVIYFATNRPYLETLLPHILVADCWLGIDVERAELVFLAAPSVLNMTSLGLRIIANRDAIGGASLLD